MTVFEPDLDAPALARYHKESVEQIIQCVEERVYCALLGPRLCGKTLLLRYIERNLARLLGWTCAYIDLQTLPVSTQQAFFADLIRLSAERLGELTGNNLPVPEADSASSAVFRAFLSDCLEITGRDLVLIIDPLEALPTDLVQALLTSLRAAYMDQQTMDHQVTVVVSGALSLASLAVGESSPFRGIARRVFVGDLSANDSQELILEMLCEHNINATRPALRKLRLAASGDLYLIRKLSQSCVTRLQSRSSERLKSRDVTVITDRFLRQEVFEYAPLVEAIRLIEEDPDLLECILQLLEHDSVPRSALPLPLSPDLDPLYLTGVLEIMEGEHYRVQNLIYRRFLTQHFSPGRVGHVLSMAGRWDAAIDYLEAGILQGSGQSRADLLPATINSIYASEDLAQAVHFIQRGLAAVFGVSESHIWFVPQQENYLRLIGPSEPSPDGETWAHQQVDINADILEARAYRQQVPLRGHEGIAAGDQEAARVVRAIPLMIPGSKPIGVATIYDDLAGQSFTELRARDLQLVGFLNQAARALERVSSRRHELVLAGKVQASLLPEALPAIPGWDMAADWRPARETAGDFYDVLHLPDGRLGIVMADVVDKGMGAALLMTLSRTLMRTFAADHPDQPERLLGAVNQRIIADLDANLFVTLFYGVLDPASGALVYSNAGHPPPYILHPEGHAPVEALAATGMPLGIADDSRWNSAHTHVPSGGLLLLYTDGVLDAQNPEGEFFGQAPMLALGQAQLGKPAREIQDALMAAVYAFAANEPQVDDITLMLLTRGSGT